MLDVKRIKDRQSEAFPGRPAPADMAGCALPQRFLGAFRTAVFQTDNSPTGV
jgi:hypothetical protein